MKLAVAALLLALLWSSPARPQDGALGPEKASTAPPRDATIKPGDASGQSGVGVQGPRVDPKMVIDVFKALTRPRRPVPPPPVPTTPPSEPAAPIIAAPPPTPAPLSDAAPPPPRPLPSAPTPIAVPRATIPKPPPAAPAPPPRASLPPTAPMPPVVAVPSGPASPVAIQPPPPPPSPLAPSVREATAAARMAPKPVPRGTSLLLQSPWLLIGLLAAAAAMAGGTMASRARRIARTRAALSLDPRLDLGTAIGAPGGLPLAGPAVAIRARLEFR